ncbi:MAG TPA: hypoxanthine-guanine phosphoribosyltransferase [Burkholderiales bacterium]|nr:hypoxanthine-guanine phosphoribosyltransferase [Burkholderiales bacterium]
MLSSESAWQVLKDAELVCSEQEVADALRRLAAMITHRLGDRLPLVLSVMGGAVVFAGQLLPMLRFPLEFDYIHVTRYDGSTRGGTVRWKVEPQVSVKDRAVLVLDDILDEGHTLAAVRQWLLDQGAASVELAVFADKNIGRSKPVVADYIGVSLPDRYVFGFGMDVNDAWRNLPAVYAVKN